MHDDEAMDQLLKDAMAAPSPQLSAEFDAKVMQRVRPRRLAGTGRVVMAVYAVIALGTTAWFMRAVPMELIVAALVGAVVVAATTSAYLRRLGFSRV